ncbi:uncharacterized protein LOC132731112 isoform X2 [Ruditapes philippinarum]|uniref:uncharacterized protein LOC132731112 isoform X2 n=1 Tax=Ruditapes philippinarum TaxID=129788 RepID=UPI00295AFB26|nr:uncharacterized protein LOC132731112 isoform X2 [Ruditapes philippinarum]
MEGNSFKSYANIKEALDKFGCQIQYKRTENSNFGYTRCHSYDYLQTVQISRCNVTGLWRQYDADIDWACRNFITPYKTFKNIYCYICNPSHANEGNQTLIENCIVKDNTYEIKEISSACKTFPISERLYPFRNIYCYACSFGHELLMDSATDASVLVDVFEKNDRASLRTEMHLSLVFPHEGNVIEVKRFIREVLSGAFQYEIKNSKKEIIDDFLFTNIEDIYNLFVTVCGNGPLCSYDRKDNETYSNPVCRYCSCENDCVENEMCCLDMTILKQPYTCVNTKGFPFIRKNEKEEIDKHFDIATESKLYKIINKCINETHELSEKCSSIGNTSSFFDDVPISTGGEISYRNIFCYECNNERVKPIILDVQAYCKTFIEHYLFTNLTDFLNAMMKHCQTISFLPLNTKTCLGKYDDVSNSHIGGEHFERVGVHSSRLPGKITREVNIPAKTLNDQVKEVFSSCNMSGFQTDTNDVLKNVCESNSVTILSLPQYRIDQRVYKNFACFLCNPVFDLADIPTEFSISECPVNSSVGWYEENAVLKELCTKEQQNDIWFPFKNLYCSECNLPPWQLVEVKVSIYDVLSPPFYKYLFSLSPEDFNKIDKAESDDGLVECLNGTYDYNLKECRSLHCQIGSRLNNSTCTPLFETAMNHRYLINLDLYIERLDFTKTDKEKGIIIDYYSFESLCSNISQTMTSPFDKKTAFYIQDQLCTAASPCIFTPKTADVPCVDISMTNFIMLFLTIYIEYTESISHIRRVLMSTIGQKYYVEDLSDIDGTLFSVELVPVKSFDKQ